jgi:CBS-domain-containing membrane protein
MGDSAAHPLPFPEVTPMKVRALMTRNVGTCRPADTLSAAAQLMWDRDCGCVPVVSDDGSMRVVGMLTDRDICMATHFRGASPGSVRVGDAMSKAVRSIGPSETPADAEAVMRDARVRRLPVVDEKQRLVGLVSLADLARAAARQHGAKKPDLSEDEIGETLEAICAARTASQLAASA